MSFDTQSQPKGVDGLSFLAGAVYGAFLGNALFGSSWLSLLVGAVVGVFFLSGIFKNLSLQTAGVLMAMGDTSSRWTADHERRGQRIAKYILTLLIIVAGLGLLSNPNG